MKNSKRILIATVILLATMVVSAQAVQRLVLLEYDTNTN